VAQLHRLQEQFGDRLVVISVHSAKFTAEKLTENIRQAAARHGIEHPVVNDAGFAIWQTYGVQAWPTVALIDPAGDYVGSQPGELMADEFAPLIQRLLDDFGEQGLLADAQTMISFAPHMALVPGLAIVFTVLGLNLMGDGLRDIFDPRLRRSRQ